MEENVKNIDEMISFLQRIKEIHGNLPTMSEYDSEYYLGSYIKVSKERNPDDYFGDKIDVVFIT